MNRITFKNIDLYKIKYCFLEALSAYPELYDKEIIVQQRSLPGLTMRAQPILDRHFFSTRRRRYRVEISNHTSLADHIQIKRLPTKVLIGWFAHELGHVRDYVDRSGFNLLRYGLGYLLFPTFRMGVERKADVYAIHHGLAEEIVATKKYIVEHSTLPNKYKKRIERYYMSPEEVAMQLQEQDEEEVMMDRVIG